MRSPGQRGSFSAHGLAIKGKNEVVFSSASFLFFCKRSEMNLFSLVEAGNEIACSWVWRTKAMLPVI
jgi:hypothetical protein